MKLLGSSDKGSSATKEVIGTTGKSAVAFQKGERERPKLTEVVRIAKAASGMGTEPVDR